MVFGESRLLPRLVLVKPWMRLYRTGRTKGARGNGVWWRGRSGREALLLWLEEFALMRRAAW